MARRQESKEIRREEILAAAWAIFAAKGFSGASMHEIAARARASKETIYALFENKTKLFETVFKWRVRTVGASLADEAPGREPVRVLYIVARDILRFLNSRENMILYSVAAGEASRIPEIRTMLAESIVRPGFVEFFRICRQLSAMSFDAEPKEMASIFVAMAQSEWPQRMSYGLVDRLTEEQIDAHAKLVSEMFMKAVAPP